MKYFVSEDDHWDLDGYLRHIPTLRPRLSQRVFRFFSNNSFHDARLLQINVVNAAAERVSRRDPTVVEISLAHRNGYVYSLRYTGVVRIDLTFDGRLSGYFGLLVGPDDDHKADRQGFHEWGYDELTEHDREYLSHEVLFHSQARLTIHFRRLSLKRSLRKHHVWG